jgi:putative transposase
VRDSFPQPTGLGLQSIEFCGLKGRATTSSTPCPIETRSHEFAGFHWRSGYGAFSVSQSDSEAVIACSRNQAEHHKKTSFQEDQIS